MDSNKFFYGDKTLMQEFINKNLAHYEADRLRQRNYFDGSKGCFLTCSAWDDMAEEEGLIVENVDGEKLINHLNEKYNLPKWLLYLLEGIFERLPPKDSKNFFKDIQSCWTTNPEGTLKNEFLYWLLMDEEHGVINFAENKEVVENVAILHKKVIQGNPVTAKEWEQAKDAAYAADAADAAYAADADAADADADAAAYAAYAAYATFADYRKTQAEKIIELLKKR